MDNNTQDVTANNAAPLDGAALYTDGFFVISDPDSGEVFVEQRDN
jgi:hypothetical protein